MAKSDIHTKKKKPLTREEAKIGLYIKNAFDSVVPDEILDILIGNPQAAYARLVKAHEKRMRIAEEKRLWEETRALSPRRPRGRPRRVALSGNNYGST